MNATYPLFTPRKGATASFAGGFQTLVDRLVERLEQLDNVHCSLGVSVASPEALAADEANPFPRSFGAPPPQGPTEFTRLSVYAVGFTEADARSVPVGYGTLIPDENAPISGVLHESDDTLISSAVRSSFVPADVTRRARRNRRGRQTVVEPLFVRRRPGCV